MERRKSNTMTRYRLYLAAILFAACLLLLVGSTWARYRTDITQHAAYAVRDAAAVQLWSVTDAGSLSTRPLSWTNTDDGCKSLVFGISNGDADSYASETQRVHVRLCASVGAMYNTDMTVELYASDPDTGETRVYTADIRQIEEISPLYNTFGEGWVFDFRDENGDEPSWTLEGGQFSAVIAEIVIMDMDVSDPALLQLQVEGDISEK